MKANFNFNLSDIDGNQIIDYLNKNYDGSIEFVSQEIVDEYENGIFYRLFFSREWFDEKGVLHKKFVIPVGNLSKEKADEQIEKLFSPYKENVEWDDSVGELKINGGKNLPYTKTIWFPSPDYTDGGVKNEEIKSDKK